MAVDQTFGVSWSGDGAGAINSRPLLSADTGIVMDFSVPASTTDQQQQIGFDVADVKGVLITASGAVKLETNATTGTQTFDFPSGGGELFWSSRAPTQWANPFTTDVTTTYWTNAGASAVTVKVRILLNS